MLKNYALWLISIHALRKERDLQVADAVLGGDISIHALRKERDRQVADAVLGGDISIHALRKERDSRLFPPNPVFSYFNPRAPQGARLRTLLRKQV